MKVIKIHRNSDPKNQPESSSRLIINYNINFEIGSNTVEDGFDGIIEYADYNTSAYTLLSLDKTLIGHILLPDNSICLFSNYTDRTIPAFPIVYTEIAILNNNTYKPILRGIFACDENFPIDGTAKIDNNGDTIIYFTDFKNSQRWLNLTTPQVAYDEELVTTEVDKLLYFPAYTDARINLIQVIQGGALPTGAYIPIYKYADKNYNETDPIFNSSVISLGDGITMGNQYDGAEPNSSSNKSITIGFTSGEADVRYSYVHLYLAYKATTGYVVYDFGYKTITGSHDFVTTISSLSSGSIVPLEAITVSRANYTTAKTVTQLDSVMYWANLKGREEIDLQPYVNNIVVNPVQNGAVLDNTNTDYRKEVIIYDKKGFLYDEVYAIYASFIIEDLNGTYETKAYHIPGRTAEYINLPKSTGSPGGYISLLENDTLTFLNTFPSDPNYMTDGSITDVSPGGQVYRVDPTARVFHAFPTGSNHNAIARTAPKSSYMGYWENEHETYPDLSNWDVKNSSGVVTNTFRTNKVRHHKFPHASLNTQNSNGTGGTSFSFHNVEPITSSADYVQVNFLGLKLSNILLPTLPNGGTVLKVNVYYAKRIPENQTILGQSLAIADNYTYPTTGGPSSLAVHCGGNFEIWDQLVGDQTSSHFYRSFFTDKKFIKCSPFDIVSTDSLTSITHVNVVQEVVSNYNYISHNGSSTPTGVYQNGAVTRSSRDFRLDDKTSLTVNRAKYPVFNRKVLVNNYIESAPPYPTWSLDLTANVNRPNTVYNAGEYGTSRNIYHYRSDKTVFLQLESMLDDATTPQIIPYYDQLRLSGTGTGLDDSTGSLTSGIYLINLRSHKQDVYLGIDKQELSFAGSSVITSSATGDLFGGDTFSNWYGYKSATDISGALNDGAAYGYKWASFELRVLHYFICQSISNINYRNTGTTNYDTYFPYTDSSTLLDNPLTPNGDPNYYNYNPAYSSVNDIHQPIIAGLVQIPNTSKFPTRIIRTAKDNIESVYDNFRVVLANDYTDLPKDKGSIWSIKGAYNKLNIFFENTFRETMGRERILTDNAESYVGAGDIFNVPPKDLMTVDGGYGGTLSQQAINITPHGLFFVDINRGKVFLKTDGLEEISKADMFYFFSEECKFKFYNSIKDLICLQCLQFILGGSSLANQIYRYENSFYKSLSTVGSSTLPTDTTNWEFLFTVENIPINGLDSNLIGFKSTYDSKYKRILLSKTDLIPTTEFINNFKGFLPSTGIPDIGSIYLIDGQLYLYDFAPGGDTNIYNIISYDDTTYFTKEQWTLGYYPEYKSWASFYTYYPGSLFNSNDSVYSTKDGKLYEHNKNILPIFYGENPEASIIELHFNNEPDMMKEFKSVQFKTKSIPVSSHGSSPQWSSGGGH